MDGYQCIRMEDFGARDTEADPFCRARVAECNVFVGLVGYLYGSGPDGSEVSFTQGEYEAAIEAKIPRLLFLTPDGFPMLLREPDALWHRQQAFRDRVKQERIVAFFDNPDSLATKVVSALTFLKYLAISLATGQGEALGLKARLPVLLPLSAYANALAKKDVRLDRFSSRSGGSRCPRKRNGRRRHEERTEGSILGEMPLIPNGQTITTLKPL